MTRGHPGVRPHLRRVHMATPAHQRRRSRRPRPNRPRPRRSRPSRVEVTVGPRTLLGPPRRRRARSRSRCSRSATLISIVLASVLAFGLDPVVAVAGRSAAGSADRASLVVFAGLVRGGVRARPGHGRAGAGREIVEFVHALPEYWDEIIVQARDPGPASTANAGRSRSPTLLKDLAAGLPEAASTLLGGGGGRVRVGALARDPVVSHVVPADGEAADHRLASGLRAARGRGALGAGDRGFDPRRVVLAAREPRDLGGGRHRGRAIRLGARPLSPDRARGHRRAAGPDPPRSGPPSHR